MAEIFTKRHIRLPCCGKEKDVEHLFETNPEYPIIRNWCCNSCPAHYKLIVNADGTIDSEVEYLDKLGFTLLKIEDEDTEIPIFIVVRDRMYREGSIEGMRYLYDEHTCPANLIRDCVQTYWGAGYDESHLDRHGIFQFVSFEEKDWSKMNHEEQQAFAEQMIELEIKVDVWRDY